MMRSLKMEFGQMIEAELDGLLFLGDFWNLDMTF